MKCLPYEVKILNWWPDFDETLCGESLCPMYISVLSKVVIKMNKTPRYWHLKIKKMAYEASGLWSKKSRPVARFWWNFVWWELMIKVNFDFKQNFQQDEQNTHILVVQKWKNGQKITHNPTWWPNGASDEKSHKNQIFFIQFHFRKAASDFL